MKVEPIVEKAFEEAKKARENAYAIYSKVKVGAAIKVVGNDQIFAGSNVEIVVNGASVCAERSAISNVVTYNGKPELEFVVVCSNTEPALTPCGVCLQVLGEFCKPELPIYISTPKGITAKYQYKDLITIPYTELPKVLDE
jgi:cytidine deaminase